MKDGGGDDVIGKEAASDHLTFGMRCSRSSGKIDGSMKNFGAWPPSLVEDANSRKAWAKLSSEEGARRH